MKASILLLALLVASALFAQDDYKFRGRLSFSMDPLFAPFYHGVASGDPLSDRVIIWTRVTPLGSTDSIFVKWQISTDTLFSQIVNSGEIWTNENKDFTVKVDVDGLSPNSWYYFRFSALNTYSIIGRTKTLPVGNCDSLRYAVVSGSNYNNGYYNAYRLMAERNDIDAVIHLGDYIYEYETHYYGNHPDRELSPNWECVTLSDYRMRYSHYRLDPDLRFAHQQYPWIVIYDDHETANDSWYSGAENHSPSQGDWFVRKANGIQAFKEWIPIREINDPLHPDNHIRRTFPLGNLANLIMIDTRLEGRDDPNGLSIDDPNKRMLGDAQYNWLTQELFDYQFTNPVKWKIIGNQVMFSPFEAFGQVLNKDQWDGYRFERQRLLNYLYGWGINNVVIITGDIHTSWACDVPNKSVGNYGSNGQGCSAVEFVTPSITSPSLSFGGGIGASLIQTFNPHIKWVDLIERGYFILDINKNRVQADWFFTNDINNHGDAFEFHGSSWYVNDNNFFIKQSSLPSLRLTPNIDFAPLLPPISTYANINNSFTLMSVNPNPFTDYVAVQFYSHVNGILKLEILTIDGKVIKEQFYKTGRYDLDYVQILTSDLINGNYIIKITDNNGYSIQRKIVKQ